MTETLTLGIETSCDETAASVVARSGPARGRILSNIVRSQWAEHEAFGGVVPEIAARAHVICLDDVIKAALCEAGVALDDLDAIAVTAGPGLIGGLIVGVTTAQALALAADLPLIGVNHLEAHAPDSRSYGRTSPALFIVARLRRTHANPAHRKDRPLSTAGDHDR